jgi:hypothetical protein
MDNHTIFLILPDELRHILIEMLDRIGSDGMGTLTPVAPIGNRFERQGTAP